MLWYIIITRHKLYYRRDQGVRGWEAKAKVYRDQAFCLIKLEDAALKPRFRASTSAEQKRSKINYLTRVKSQGENYRQGNYNFAHVHGVVEMAPRDTPRVHGKFKVTFTRNAFPSVRLGFNSCLP